VLTTVRVSKSYFKRDVALVLERSQPWAAMCASAASSRGAISVTVAKRDVIGCGCGALRLRVPEPSWMKR